MNKGVYGLIMYLKYESVIMINSKPVKFPKGYYCYVGSALNNLQKRIERHQRKEKKKHWHIDYFLDKAKIIDVKTKETEEKIECEISNDVKGLKGNIVMKKFGSTDCKCETHLYHFQNNPIKELGKVFR